MKPSGAFFRNTIRRWIQGENRAAAESASRKHLEHLLGHDRRRARRQRHITRRLPVREYLQIVAASNLKQRTRMATLYYHAEARNYAVIGTANKNEHDQGFFVKYGRCRGGHPGYRATCTRRRFINWRNIWMCEGDSRETANLGHLQRRLYPGGVLFQTPLPISWTCSGTPRSTPSRPTRWPRSWKCPQSRFSALMKIFPGSSARPAICERIRWKSTN